MKRSTATRWRGGMPEALSIAAVWIRVHSPRLLEGVSAEITAALRYQAALDVQTGDVFELSDGRLFQVQLIKPEQATNLAFCNELKALIPDEFESGIINPWWTMSGAGEWAVLSGQSRLQLAPPIVAAPNAAAFLTQTVTNEFDVRAQLTCPMGGAGNVHRALLGFRSGTLGCYVGSRGNGALAVVRLDDDNGSVTETSVAVTASWLRLRRTGCDFMTYYATTADEPSESDWQLLAPSSTPVQTLESGTVGLGGYVTAGAAAAMTFDWLRSR